MLYTLFIYSCDQYVALVTSIIVASYGHWQSIIGEICGIIIHIVDSIDTLSDSYVFKTTVFGRI
jgi:hypothetical protein